MYPVASFHTNRHSVSSSGMFASPAALESNSSFLSDCSAPCGPAREEITWSRWAVWLTRAVQAGMLMYMYLCNASRHKDAFKQPSTYTYRHMLFVWQALPAWLKLLYHCTFSFMYSPPESLRNFMQEKKIHLHWLYLGPSPLFRYGTSSNATLSGFCLYKACSFRRYSHLRRNVNT